MKNRYIKNSKISEAKFREILKYFCEDLEINKISKFTGISRQSLSKIFKEIRILMANECEKILPSGNVAKRSGEIEAGESYFLLCNLLGGVKRVRGKRGRGAANKISF